MANMSPQKLHELKQLSRMIVQDVKMDCEEVVNEYCMNAADNRIFNTLWMTAVGTLGLLWLDERKQQRESTGTGTGTGNSTSTATSSQVHDKPPSPLHK